MEGKGSSLMFLFQKYSDFSSSACRYIFKQDLMRRCHLNWNCLVLPCVDTKGDDGAEIFRLQPTTAAYVSPSLHQQSLPRAFWGGWVLPAAFSFPWVGSLESASQLQASVLFSCCHHRIGAAFGTVPGLFPVCCCSGWGWNTLTSPLPWGRLSGCKGCLVVKADHHCPGEWLAPSWAAWAPAGCDNGQCC